MIRDKLGKELKEGDLIIVSCRLYRITGNDDSPKNLEAITIDHPPAQSGHFVLHGSQVARHADPTAEGHQQEPGSPAGLDPREETVQVGVRSPTEGGPKMLVVTQCHNGSVSGGRRQANGCRSCEKQ